MKPTSTFDAQEARDRQYRDVRKYLHGSLIALCAGYINANTTLRFGTRGGFMTGAR